ncbi:MAG: zinc ribbon domain-containing protein [Carboxydocellales bacterium]
MFCHQCGIKANTGDKFCRRCGTELAGNISLGIIPGQQGVKAGARQQASLAKYQLLAAIEQILAQYPLDVSRSVETDLEIHSVLADANWGVGKKKVEYKACLLAKEDEKTVVYWEMIKETGAGIGNFWGIKVESYSSNGRTISGKVRENGYSPEGKVVDYNWDYGNTRGIVQETANAKGWRFKTVLMKRKAMY